MNIIENIDNYRRVLEPFATKEDADAAIDKFFDEVMKLRNECKLPDVSIVIKAHARIGDKVATLATSGHLGNTAEFSQMLIWALKNQE